MGRRGADLVSSRAPLPSAQSLCQQPLHSSDSSLIFLLWFLPLGTNLQRKLGSSLWGWGDLEPLLCCDHCSVTAHGAPSHVCPFSCLSRLMSVPSAPGLAPESGAAPPCSHPPGLAEGQPDAHCSHSLPLPGVWTLRFPLGTECVPHSHSSVTGALPEPQVGTG